MIAALALLCAPAPARAAGYEGVARGFPVLRDSSGSKLADGSFAQWLEGEELVAVITYDFSDGRRVEEKSRFSLKPRLAQRAWSWRETRGGAELRRFEADLSSGTAEAVVTKDGKTERWKEDVKGEPGRTFCGFGFTAAIAALLPPESASRELSLTAVVFTPKPRAAPVLVTDEGEETLSEGGRAVKARRYRLRPALPAPIRKLLGLKEYRIWLSEEPPPGFLRMVGPLVEPRDPLVRVDVSR